MLYGTPTKHIRHIHDTGQIEIDAQESLMVNFWHTDTSKAATADGTDVNEGEDNEGIALPLGSKVKRHKVTTTIEPSTIEPQNIYIGRVSLSFQDVLAPQLCGQDFSSTGFQGTVTETNLTDYDFENPVTVWPDNANLKCAWTTTVRASRDIDEVKLNELLRHFITFKKVTLFDQRPLLGDRWQRIPKKTKRLNPYTWEGLVIINDSQTVGEVVQFQMQQYLEHMEIETPPTSLYT
jgi:hypothetical protein